jgi:hypothetical protein
MSASIPPVPPAPPPPTPAHGAGRTIAGIFAGLALSIVAAVVCGFVIAASPAAGLGATAIGVVALLVAQIRRWKRATAFQRGLLLGQILCALIAGACFAMLMNLKIH